jgi:hypothetical protein
MVKKMGDELSDRWDPCGVSYTVTDPGLAAACDWPHHCEILRQLFIKTSL